MVLHFWYKSISLYKEIECSQLHVLQLLHAFFSGAWESG